MNDSEVRAGQAKAEPAIAIRTDVIIEESDEGFARLRIPLPETRFRRFLSFIFRLPGYKILILDETGTQVLSFINGRRGFSELAGLLAEARSMGDAEAKGSMAAFLDRLASERVIEFCKPGGCA